MRCAAVIAVLLTLNFAYADSRTIGPEGIDCEATGLNGEGIEIGQIEGGRPGNPGYGIPPEPSASNTKPTEVYFRTLGANAYEALDEHATLVAEVMIGDDSGGGLYEGVAPNARLHSAAVGSFLNEEISGTAVEEFGLTADRLARISGPDPNDPNHIRRMRAINISAYFPLDGTPANNNNGNSHVTLFVDWSASRHDVLYVAGWGNNDSAQKRAPSDNFNGMTEVDPKNWAP